MKTLVAVVLLLARVSAFAGAQESPRVSICFAGKSSKLESIIIPKFEVRDVTVAEAIEFLRMKSRQLDPEGVGVNIVLKLPADGGAAAMSKAAPLKP